jgi:Protein of unknown function DUF2617
MTKEVIPIIQGAKDLRLAIVTEDVLPMLRVLQEASLHYQDFWVHFAIIGESHRIRIQRGSDFILEEMLACVEIAPRSCWHYHDFTDLAAHCFQQPQYTMNTYFSSELAPKRPSVASIEYTFPAIHNFDPITRIEWKREGNILRWWTLHSYAETEKFIAVHTQSEFHF